MPISLNKRIHRHVGHVSPSDQCDDAKGLQVEVPRSTTVCSKAWIEASDRTVDGRNGARQFAIDMEDLSQILVRVLFVYVSNWLARFLPSTVGMTFCCIFGLQHCWVWWCKDWYLVLFPCHSWERKAMESRLQDQEDLILFTEKTWEKQDKEVLSRIASNF